MTSPQIGIVVDGHGDYAALRTKFKGQAFVLKSNGSRGHTTSAQALVLSSGKELQMLQDLGCRTVCLLTDLEGRRLAPADFCSELSKHLPPSTNKIKFVVACANQMIENWILADIVEVANHSVELKKVTSQKSWEGRNGKKELKKHFKPGRDYNEVRHGEKFFAHVRNLVARKNSESFDDFLRQVGW